MVADDGQKWRDAARRGDRKRCGVLCVVSASPKSESRFVSGWVPTRGAHVTTIPQTNHLGVVFHRKQGKRHSSLTIFAVPESWVPGRLISDSLRSAKAGA